MRAKIILLLTILLFSFTNTQAQEKVKEDTKFKTWWVKTFDPKGKIKSPKKIDKTPKKELIRQRDSLILVIDSLSRNLDMVYAEKEELVEEVLTSDSINDGKFLGSLYNGYIEDAGNGDTDSLINLWYEHKTLSFADTSFSAIDDCDFQSNIPDSVYLNRLAKMNSFISVPYNRQIRNYIIAYTVKNKITLERVLGIAPYYMPQFEEIFDKFDLPIELTAMAIIESALNPVAVSRARAKGMWQFMYSTGKMYNLTINSYVDERFDPIESAYAAAKYLKDSYKIYGDWALAISSYNCGIGNVNKAIRRSGGSKEFWKIYPYLPRETRGYLPSFVAALYTLNYYKEHNLTPLAVSFPKNIDTIKVNKMLHLEQVCHFTGIGLKELKDLNPQYLHNIIPGTSKEYILKLPYEYIPKFIDNEDTLYTYKDSIYFNPSTLKKIEQSGSSNSTRIIHRVKSGETVGHIAIRYHVKVRDIQRWNNVKTNIRIGQKLVIYTNGGPKYSSSGSKTSVSKGYETYTIKNGDSLWLISKRFNIPFNSLLKINGMNKNSKIYPGMKIKLRKA